MTLAATLWVHIAAGVAGLIAGAVAISAAKGATLHRGAGLVFVAAMLVMGGTGFVVAVARDLDGSITGGPTAAYFVITALTTVRPLGRRLDIAMVLLALWISAMCFALAVGTWAGGRMITASGVPIPMILLFGIITLASAASDVRLLRNGPARGPQRIARHLWRMCFAFWIATGSFFLGQMDEFPVWLQNGALMSIPAFFPLAVMVYWLWRIRIRRVVAGFTVRQAA